MAVQRAPIPVPKGKFYGWVIVWVTWVASFVTAPMNPVVFSMFIVPMRDELHVGNAAIAWAITVRMLSAGIAAPWVGRWLDRYGARWVGAIGGLLSGLAMIGLFFLDNIWLMYGLFALSGVTGFGVFGGGNILATVPVANWFLVKRGRAISIAATGGGLGTAMGVPIAQLLVHAVGWRWSFVIFGLVILAIVVPAYALLMRRRPEDLGLHLDGVVPVGGTPTPTISTGTAQLSPRQDVSWTARQAMRSPVLWVAMASFTLYSFFTSGVLFMRVPFWVDLGVSPQVIAFGMASDPLVVMFTMLAFGFLAERYAIRFLAVLGGIFRAISMVPFMIGTGSAAWVFGHNVTWGTGSGGMGTAQNLLIPDYYGRAAQGAIRGIVAPFMIAAGALGAPAIGLMMDAGISPTTLFRVTLGVFLLCGLVFIFLKPPGAPSKRKEAVAAEASASAGTPAPTKAGAG